MSALQRINNGWKRLSQMITLILISGAVITSCDIESPKTVESDAHIITDSVPVFLSDWVGPEGVLARFGPGSTIGAIMHYDSIHEKRFIIFDGTGKRFLWTRNVRVEGPFPVKDLFTEVNYNTQWFSNLDTDSSAQAFANVLDSIGVEAAVFAQNQTFDDVAEMSFVTKDGMTRVIWGRPDLSIEIKDRSYGMTSHTYQYFQGNMDAMMWIPSLNGNQNYKGVILVDSTGTKMRNGDGKNLGKVDTYWPKLPTDNVEGIAYYEQNSNSKVNIVVLGPYRGIPGGTHLYVTETDTLGITKGSLVDLNQ